MNKCHENINWHNDTTPAINETNLNYMDGCIDTVDDRIVSFDTTKANQSDLLQSVKNVTYNTTTGVITVIWWNGNTFTIDLNIEKIPVNFTMSETGVITMTTADGTEYTADISTVLKLYTFVDSDEIDFTVVQNGNNYTVTASIVEGSITADKLQPNFLADCQAAANTASGAATASNANRLESEGWAVGKQDGVDVPSTSPYYHNNAKYFAERTGGVSLEALNDVTISNKQPDDSLVWDDTLGKWVNKNVSTKFALLPVSDVTATPTDSTVALAWTNPGNVLVGGTVVAEFYKTKIIRKEGSAPTDITDGTEVYDGNGTSFTDTDLTENTTYYYAFYAYTNKDVYSDATVESVTTQGQGHLLPDDYQQVMYLESHGTEYIDSGISAYNYGNNMKIELKGAAVNTNNATIFLGCSSASSAVPVENIFMGAFVTPRYGMCYGANDIRWEQSIDTLPHTYIIDAKNSVCSFDGSSKNIDVGTFPTNRNIYLFGRQLYEGGWIAQLYACKIYSCKFWNNDVLTRYFVPCYRKSDGVAGLYDVVNDVFYTNQGSGEFTCGVSIDALPDGYTQVEYIQSTDTQYIDTGVQPSTSLTKIDFSAFDISYDASTKTQHIFGAYISGKGAFMTGASSATANYRYYNGTWYTSGVASSINHISVQITPSALTINGNATSISGVASDHSETMIIFGAMNNGVTTLVSSMKLCHFRIARSGAYIRDFIPCKNASNVVGFYDCVNGVFYDNDGTGDFIAGPPIVPTPTETITLTLEGAKEDNIIIKDAHGDTVGTCIFASGATSGTVTLDIAEDWPYTFESTVAKDTTSGTSNYTKTVNLNKTSANVNVYPEGALYWYGNSIVTINDWKHSGFSEASYTFSELTNYKHLQISGNVEAFGGFCTNDAINVSRYSYAKAKVKKVNWSSGGTSYIGLSNNKLINASSPTWTIERAGSTESETVISLNVQSVSSSAYVTACWYAITSSDLYALWLE